MIYALIAVGILIVAFIWWRYTSVARGARQRDEKLMAVLDPLAQKLSKKEPVTAEEIANLSRQPQYRPMLYQLLKHYERLDLFPADALSIQAQGAGILAYWMMHPNELQDAPSEIELVEEIEKDIQGERARFLVHRYRMPSGHWAGDDGWTLGLAGPFVANDVPYSGLAAGFSRCGDKHGEVKPEELIDWFVGMVTRKSA
jgi:hypothetical protein